MRHDDGRRDFPFAAARPLFGRPMSTMPAASASSPTSRATRATPSSSRALKILENLDHRGAVGADKLMGDGAGILIQMPDALYREEMAQQGVELPPPGEYGVGMIFLPQGARVAPGLRAGDRARRSRPRARCCSAGATCRSTATCRCRRPCASKEPVIRQVFIGRGSDVIVTRTRSSASCTSSARRPAHAIQSAAS